MASPTGPGRMLPIAVWAATCVVAALLAVASCARDPGTTSGSSEVEPPRHPVAGATSPPAAASALDAAMTWHWQLQGELDRSTDVDAYDIDLFDTDAAVIAELRRDGRVVICYFSAGSFESWRSDAGSFPPEAIGDTLDGWEDERWLDIRSPAVRSAMLGRLDLAAGKGCDGVEPDNVTAWATESGFAITADDQLEYNRFLAAEAHQRGLLIGLKNDLEQIPELVDGFDFAVNEQCIEYRECDAYRAFVDAGKPVLNVEYAERFVADPAPACEVAAQHGLRTLVLPVELDGSFRIACP